jgi:outer membrane lipoprotein carrier protein
MNAHRTAVSAVAGATVALALSAQSLTAQAGAEAAYDRVAKAWATHTTLSADFEQRINNPLLGRTASSRGTFLQQKPGRVSITFTEPAGDRIVSDGSSLWVYLPSSAPNQVMKLPANSEGAVVADLLGQLLEAPKKSFAFTGGEAATIDGRATRRVLMTPKVDGSVPFTKATLWLDDKEPRPVRVQVTDQQGVERTITMLTWSPNATLPKNAFTFTPPKGAKVITKIPGA